MLFTWDTSDLCIIFRRWHISSTSDLIISLLGVVILTAGYEFVRELSRRYEASSAEHMNKLPSKQASSKQTLRAAQVSWLSVCGCEVDDDEEQNSLHWSGKSRVTAEVKVKVIKAAFYAVQVFYSFFIM